MATDPDVVVRRRIDGIAQIVPVRSGRLRRVEPYAGTLALALVAVGLYVAALVSAAFVALLVAGCGAFEVHRARKARAVPSQPAAEVRTLRRTGTRP